MELEKLSDLTWPAEKIVEYGKWRLRISDGFKMRANSALPLGAGPIGEPPIALEGAVQEVINIYRENKLTPSFAIALPIYEELDQYLDKTGWSMKFAADFMIRDIGKSEFTVNKDFTCELSDTPSKLWLEIQSDQPLENLMNRYPARYGAIKVGEKIVAVGRIATSGTWSIVTRLFVEPSFRGKGVAKFLMNNLLAAASSDGAAKVGLQVDDDNASALALYESMGFRTHHKFVYRTLIKKRDK
jgi:ribosomal protein S18 acetylase RimI-like enzyme